MQSLHNQLRARYLLAGLILGFIWRGSPRGDETDAWREEEEKKQTKNSHVEFIKYWIIPSQVHSGLGGLILHVCIMPMNCRSALISSPIVFLLRWEGPGDVQSVYFANWDDCKHTHRCTVRKINTFSPFWTQPLLVTESSGARKPLNFKDVISKVWSGDP